MEARVYRWAPSAARSVLSTVGLARKTSSAPVERFAVLSGLVLEYYHHEESYRNDAPPSRVSLRLSLSLSPPCMHAQSTPRLTLTLSPFCSLRALRLGS